MEIVTGLRGTPHITSADTIGFQQGIATVGSGALPVGEKFRSELASNNELKIYDGEGVIQGVHFRVLPGTYDSITLENGAQGQKRKDLIVVRYTKDAETGYENTVWAVKKGTSTTGTPAEPTATEGDIRAGDALAEVPWYVVEYDGINVTSVTPKFSTLMNIQELTEGFSELNRNMKYTHLQSDVYGYIELPSGLKAVYGVYPLNGLASDAATGGYTRTIDISSYGLQDPVWAIATALYPSGWPETAVHHANKNEIKIGSKYNNAGGAIQWMVIG